MLDWLQHPDKVEVLQQRFTKLHNELRRPTALLVAQVLAEMITK